MFEKLVQIRGEGQTWPNFAKKITQNFQTRLRTNFNYYVISEQQIKNTLWVRAWIQYIDEGKKRLGKKKEFARREHPCCDYHPIHIKGFGRANTCPTYQRPEVVE